MNGKQEYETKELRRINALLKKNDEYLSSYYSFIGMNKTLETRYRYLIYVSNFVNEINKPLNELDMHDFTMYISDAYVMKSSSLTIAIYSALKLFGKFLYASEILPKDPMQFVQRPKFVETKEAVEKRENGFLTKEEIEDVKNQIENGVGSSFSIKRQEHFKNRDMLIVLLLISTGLRCSALTRLDISDIDCANREFIMYDKGNKVSKYSIPKPVIDYYRKWLIDRKRLMENAKEPTDALFISRNRKRMSQQSVSNVVQKFTSVTGKHITPHKLRATYGTQLYDATHDIYFVQQCMHHSSPKTTELYVRGKAADTDRSADIIGKIL